MFSINHIAIWTKDLETTKHFYLKWFNVKVSDKYINRKKEFESYFLTFTNGIKLEIMFSPEYTHHKNTRTTGLAHFAISVGSKHAVDQLVEQLRAVGVKIISEPRTTGDGYYESVISDPEGNLIEITI